MIVAGLSPAAFAKVLPANSCPDLKSALVNLETNLKSPASADILEGTMSREYRTAYKARLAAIAAEPRVAKEMAESLSNPTSVLQRDPNELLLTLDALAKASSDAKVGLSPFVISAESISKAFRELPKSTSIENLDRFRSQYANRIINSLDLADHRDALKLFRLIEVDEHIRKRFVLQNNAPLAMVRALKKIAPADVPGPEIAAQLHSARVVANAWIKPQLKIALSPKPLEKMSGQPEGDWALARVLATEMKRLLKAGDPGSAAKYEEADKKLAQVKEAAAYMTDPRVQDWFKTYNVPH